MGNDEDKDDFMVSGVSVIADAGITIPLSLFWPITAAPELLDEWVLGWGMVDWMSANRFIEGGVQAKAGLANAPPPPLLLSAFRMATDANTFPGGAPGVGVVTLDGIFKIMC